MEKPRGRKINFLLEKKDTLFSIREKGYSYSQIAKFIEDEYGVVVNSTTINRFFLKAERIKE